MRLPARSLARARITACAFVVCAPMVCGGAAAQTALQQARLNDAVALYEGGAMAEARQRFEALAREGVPAADHDLAVMLLAGDIGPSDPLARQRLALRHMQRAADRGFVTAQWALGRMHELGQGTPRDLRAAMRAYERAAGHGSVEAMVEAGTGHYLGRGVPRDASRALRWYLRAATAGDVGAQYLAASMYEHGDTGVAPDALRARRWYEAAAAQGDPAAKAKLEAMDAGAQAAGTPLRARP